MANSVFGYLYGAGLATMAKQLGSHADKARDVVDALRAITPGLVEWDRMLRARVEAKELAGWVHPSGRVAHFNADAPHKSLNTIVQGYGRELLVDAMLRWEAIHPGATVLPIHDELVVQAPADEAEQWAADLGAAMTCELAVSGTNTTVPIVSEVEAPTRRWGVVE